MLLKNWTLILLIAQIYKRGCSVSVDITTATSTNWSEEEDDEEEWEGDEKSTVSGKQYKNPRNSPSTLCPRDEEQATLLHVEKFLGQSRLLSILYIQKCGTRYNPDPGSCSDSKGQRCSRKCSSDEDCKSKKKKCLCDGLCGMSCIKPDRECPEAEQIPFGTVTLTGRLFGDRLTYACQHGYHVVGLQSRTCQADGQWARTAPSCKQNIYCLLPPTIDHARHNALPEQTTFDLDSTLQYFCHNGYVTNGFPRAKCLAIDGQASWYGPDISCEPRSCGSPQDISHGWHAGECYTYGCRINYHCAEGFELVGKAEKFCQSDGTWSPKELPTCVPVQCPTPENPRYGKAIYTSCSYNSVVSYECKYGYTLIGETTRRCGADRKWSGSQPVCKEINCGHPGRLWNGWLENIEAGTGLGASIIFRCHEGMTLEGNSSTVCLIDGKWRYPLPKCLAPCVVPQVAQGKVVLVSQNDTAISSTVVPHGDALFVECDPQYEFLASSSPVACNNGTWTHIPKCQPARCKHLPKSPKHGMVIAPKINHGMKAKFACKDGYELKGNELVECSFGNWSGELPTCQEVYCPFPGLIEFGKILLVGNMGLYDYRPYVRKVTNNKQIMYDCDKGYVLDDGPSGATCIGGKWSPSQLPKCTLGQHPRLRWSRRKRSAFVEFFKRSYMRHTKLFYKKPKNLKVTSIIEQLFHDEDAEIRKKRALKSTSSSRTFGLGHKSGGSSLSLRRNNKKLNNDITVEKQKKKKHKILSPCLDISDVPHLQVEIIKASRDTNSTYGSATVVKVACSDGYELNMAEINVVKCVRGKWRPITPDCLIRGEGGVAEGGVAGGGAAEGDIIKESDITQIEYSVPIKTCGPPAKVQGSLVYRNGEPLIDSDQNFPDGTEVTFNCIESIMGERNTWKIICEDGNWIGRSLRCDIEELLTAKATSNSTCVFRNQELNVKSFYNDQEIREDIVEFQSGAVLISRCSDIGKYSMIGPNKRRCMGGDWDLPKPLCFGLNQENDYSMEKPPTILFRHEMGPIAQSNDGKLIVYPGTVLHMECLWMKRFGNPKWNISHNYRKYQEGWSTDPGRDSQLEYRLSIYHTSKEDSGIFTCETPARQTHSVEIIVKAVHCPLVPKKRGLTVNTQSTKMNTQLKFTCVNGNALIGAEEITCLPSGNWSAPFPVCESIECGEVGDILPPHLRVAVGSREVGARAHFSCDSGFGINGPHQAACLSSGEWASPFPTCVEVQCDNPGVPENGYIQGTGPFKAGDVIQFNCNADYMMEGQPIIACQDNGRWSGPLPKCAQACSYPGTTISGRMSSVKFYYKLGENITFTCDDGYLLHGAAMLKCLKNGKWSNAIPTCALGTSDIK